MIYLFDRLYTHIITELIYLRLWASVKTGISALPGPCPP